jgi:hypothetical protein
MAWFLMMTLNTNLAPPDTVPSQGALLALVGEGRMAGQGMVMGSSMFSMAVRYETEDAAVAGLERFRASTMTVLHHELKEMEE